MSTYVSVVISPATTTRPVVISVSHATRPFGSSVRTASRTESEIWSAILSGWPSVTDSDVNWNVRGTDMPPRLAEPADPYCRSRKTVGSAFRCDVCLGTCSLLGRLSTHQGRCQLVQVLAGENRANSLRDRQLDADPRSQIPQYGRRRQALHDLPDLGRGLVRRGSARDQLAGVAVSPVATPAGDRQVAHAREAEERLRAGAAGLAEAGHLCEAARDQRRLRVVPEAEPVDAAGGERDHVLRGGAELDADRIRIHVDAEGD